MTGRETIVSKFSTFLCLVNSQRRKWEFDRKLERSMKLLVKEYPEAKEDFLARKFLNVLRDVSANPKEMESGHLSAYLQEPCLWASHKIYDKLQFIRNRYPLEEFFQIASTAASNPAKILRGFQFDRPEATIKSYARVTLQRIITNTLYEHDIALKASKLSDYRLLRCLTKKELKEALGLKRIQEAILSKHLLAWLCFREVYQPVISNGRLEPPNEAQLQEMVKVFNLRLSATEYACESINVGEFQKYLSTCIQAARDYRKASILPIEDCSEIEMEGEPWKLVVQEDEWNYLRQMIAGALESLCDEGKSLIYVYYGLGLTQTEVAVISGENQYKISRRLDKYRRELLKVFFRQWNEKNPDERINDTIIDSLEKPMSEYLKQQCEIWLDKLLYYCWNGGQNPNFKNDSKRKIEAELKLADGSLDRLEAKIFWILDEWLKKTTNGGC
ncbi:hypothetical protein NG798_23330 [Ancylothrix sp. C2]|uniref:hypothetical protein n=1 Tax=Ancylothrix sp. D3o TaxID=2953691 RepID=UPI0021BBAD7D|nr:hypothetical protein [Ancylothrix sp. D3o]MCT7952737.1 hypothetical protein [Ancylothrix sp. D3o]